MDPEHIMQVGMGFFASKTLLSAVELGVFTELASQPTAPMVSASGSVCTRGVVATSSTAWSRSASSSERVTARTRSTRTRRTARCSWTGTSRPTSAASSRWRTRASIRFWADLTEALRTGAPQNEMKLTGRPMFDELYADPARLEQFMHAMAGISAGNFQAFAEKFDFSRYSTLTDVGGATGLLSTIVAQRHPHLRCTTCDLPVVRPIAERAIAAAGVADRVSAVDLDFFADPIPPADVVTMGMILHDWNLEKKMHLIRAAYDALPEGGAFIVVENLIDDARRENAFGLMMSLNMLIEFGDAFDYTGADFAGWCREVGFRDIEIMPLAGPASAGIAYK